MVFEVVEMVLDRNVEMSWIRTGAVLVVCMTLLVAGCKSSDEDDSFTSASVPTAEEAVVATTARDDAASAAERRLGELKSQIGDLERQAENADLSSEMSAQLAGMQTSYSEARRAIDELKQAEGETIATAEARLDGVLTGLQTSVTGGGREIEEMRARKRQESIAAVKPLLDKGVAVGLDGINYLAYRTQLVIEVQERLKALGHYDGPADGFLEGATKKALGRFQDSQGIWASGVPTPRTRELLFGESS